MIIEKNKGFIQLKLGVYTIKIRGLLYLSLIIVI